MHILCKDKNDPDVFAPKSRKRYPAYMLAKEIRKQRGLTQVELADMVGIEQAHISRFENGSGGVTLNVAKKIADALCVSVADLFQDDRSAAEQMLIEAFRALPPDRRQGWLDMARALAQNPTERAG